MINPLRIEKVVQMAVSTQVKVCKSANGCIIS
jgi:hypothetical protein